MHVTAACNGVSHLVSHAACAHKRSKRTRDDSLSPAGRQDVVLPARPMASAAPSSDAAPPAAKVSALYDASEVKRVLDECASQARCPLRALPSPRLRRLTRHCRLS